MKKLRRILVDILCMFIPIKKLKNKIRPVLLGTPPTETLIIESISACQVRCLWCSPQNFQKHPSGYMSAKQFEQIISKNIGFIKKNYGAILPYSRGEAFIHPEIWDIFEILYNYGLFDKTIEIHSNLSMEIDIEKLKKYKLRIVANFGGTTKEMHEQVMRNSNFELVIKNLKMFADNGIAIAAKITPTKQNLNQLKDFNDFIKNILGKEIRTIIGTTGIMAPYSLTKEEMDIYFEEVVSPEMNEHLRFTYDLMRDDKNIIPKNEKCPYLIHTILYDGQFTICCHDKEGLINCGNVFETPLNKIVSSKKYKNASNAGREMKLQICKGCN